MTVKDFVKASYMNMIFRDEKTHDVIYNFQWNDDIGECDFITGYGHYDVIKFKSHCDGVIDVFIESGYRKMVKIYLITFYTKGKKLCTRLEEAENEDEALMNSEFSLICNGMEYDDFKVELIPEGIF